MDFGTFITVVIFIIVISQFIKRLGAAKKTRASGKTQTWRQKVEDTLSQFRMELEKAQKAGSQTSADLERADMEEVDFEEVEDIAIERSPISRNVSKDVVPKKIIEPAPPHEVKTASPHMGYANVRNGIIWSEILGPPLALKNEREDRLNQ